MANIFLTADHHFGHSNTYAKFLVNGLPMRPFSSVDEMNEFMVARWNETVKPSDKVYHLGDVAMTRADIAIVGRCHGHKRLVRGNHDIFPMKYYTPFFEEIYGVRVLDRMILSHIPLHPESLNRWTANIHGHTHNNVPALHFGPQYLNVSVEATEYRPLAIEEVRQRVAAQKAYLAAFHEDPEGAYNDRFTFHGTNGHLLAVRFK
jgi:calcineurin-like phosphoesterase family protein